MKIITKKQAAIIADNTAASLQNVLRAHGVKPKYAIILKFRYELCKALGGKK